MTSVGRGRQGMPQQTIKSQAQAASQLEERAKKVREKIQKAAKQPRPQDPQQGKLYDKELKALGLAASGFDKKTTLVHKEAAKAGKSLPKDDQKLFEKGLGGGLAGIDKVGTGVLGGFKTLAKCAADSTRKPDKKAKRSKSDDKKCVQEIQHLKSELLDLEKKLDDWKHGLMKAIQSG